MKQNFAAMILGGTGQVGSAAVTELLAIPDCREIVMVIRKPVAPRSTVRNVVVDSGSADFAERTHTTHGANRTLAQYARARAACTVERVKLSGKMQR
jgi:uncharacterized protein YbjT (DUF2867 family)